MGVISILIELFILTCNVIFVAGYFIFVILKKTYLIYPVSWFICSLIIYTQEGKIHRFFENNLISIIWLLLGAVITIVSLCCMVRGIIRLVNEDFCWGDIPKFFSSRKDIKEEIKWFNRKNELYKKYPNLRKEEVYFKTEVCRDETKVLYFEYDWKMYLLSFIDDDEKYMPFDDWFEKNERWKTTDYNSLYFKKYGQQREKEEHITVEEKPVTKDSNIWFAGVSSEDELHKRYKELMKIYHPDNKTGDNTITVKIQNEYNSLLKNY